MNTLVLGAGIAGISYAYHRKDDCVTVYEKNSYIGGLCHSFSIQGFTFDSAVHLCASEIDDVLKVFRNVQIQEHQPVAYNFYEGLWLKHPVYYNLHKLPSIEKTNIIYDYVERDKSKNVCNYEDWLLASYGKTLYDDFYRKYTKKYWTCEPNNLSTNWLGVRFPEIDLYKMLQGTFGEIDNSHPYVKKLIYPQNGGFQAFVDYMAKNLTVKLNTKVKNINLNERMIEFDNGEAQKYDKLVSSIPLPELVAITQDVPDKIKISASRLKASKISIVSVGFNRDVSKYLWLYIYDEDIRTARINSPSMKSINNVPSGCSSLQFEIYHRHDEIINGDEIIENVKYTIKKMGIADENDIRFIDHRVLDYGNVIFTLDMEENREIIRNFYISKGVELIGRFGEWDYLWSDQSFMSGKLAAEK